MTSFTLRSLVALMAALMLSPARAGSASGSFAVNATVVGTCTVSGSLLNFGSSINPLTATPPLDATSTLTVQCTNTTPYSVALDAGSHAGGSANFGARAMLNGLSTLGYQLYSDSTRAVVWGDGSGGSLPVLGVGSGSNQSLTIYGRLPSLSGAIPGTYSDTVTVTISY